jgi:3-phenylpropionate/trans-cinnamate dioxygenase ferredoxin subunit
MAIERIAAVDDVKPEEPVRLVAGGEPICVVRIADDFFAVHDTCTHADVSLSEGELDVPGRMIECWKHGSCFSLVDGHPDVLPAVKPVRVYRIWADGDDLLLDTEPVPKPGEMS